MSKKKLFIILQYLVPQHTLSRLLGWLANCRWCWFKNIFIKWFVHHYQVDLSIAAKSHITDYASFNEFFTRKLQDKARPLAATANTIICPADSTISQIGNLDVDTIIQAKNFNYSLSALLGGKKYSQDFYDGNFITLYLAPKDYHRVHIPVTGKLLEMTYVPGKLFSVNPTTTTHIPNLFAKNERVICVFATDIGKMAVVMIGAMIVASVYVAWAGQVMPNKSKTIQAWNYIDTPVVLERGAELGYFALGSTVIVLFESNKMQWETQLNAGNSVQFGQALGCFM
jgi:phosphatidylserine decarboxylase